MFTGVTGSLIRVDPSIPVASFEHKDIGPFDPTPGSPRKGKRVSNVSVRSIGFVESTEVNVIQMDDPSLSLSPSDQVLQILPSNPHPVEGSCGSVWFDEKKRA